VELAPLVDAAFAYLCTRRVSELVDAQRLLDAADAALTQSRIERIIARFVAPSRARVIEWARARDHALGEWLPDGARDAIAHFLGAPAPIPRAVVDEVVASERVRDSVRAMLQEALQSVIAKAFAAAPGGRAARGVLGLGARAASAAGRSLFGGLGEELQRQLEERVRDFVDGGVGMVQVRIAQKLTSDETARMLGQRRRRAFLDVLKRTEAQAARFVGRAPFALVDAVIALVVPHNLGRADVRELVRAELAAAITEASTQTIGELLDELGLRGQAAELWRATVGPLAAGFVGSAELLALAK
jgi:hypothetical protein